MMPPEGPGHQERPPQGIYGENHRFYDSIWKAVQVRDPSWFNTWTAVEEIARGRRRLLEIGPGARPRLSLLRGLFIDLSPEAARKLRRAGARAVCGNAAVLPFPDGAFEAVIAMDVVEHAHDPGCALREIGRILRGGGLLLFSVPLYRRHWTRFDDLVGHHVRYEPSEILGILQGLGLSVLRSAPFGILPGSRWLVRIGAFFLARLRGPAVWFEDRIVLPLAHRFQRPLRWSPGFVEDEGADGVILWCEKRSLGTRFHKYGDAPRAARRPARKARE